MLLAMFVAGTTKSFSQNMNKRTEETPQSVIANAFENFSSYRCSDFYF